MPKLSARAVARLLVPGALIWLTGLGLDAQDSGVAAAPPGAAPSLCRSAGRLACELPPSGDNPEQLCRQLTACLENRRFSESVVKEVTMCEALLSTTRVSGGSTLALAAVSATVTGMDDRQYHAAYLVGRYASGFCVLDELLDPTWSPNSCEAVVKFAARPRALPAQIEVEARRTCYDTRDQEELAAGVSNVRSRQCVSVRYELRTERVTRLLYRERPCLGERAKL